MNEGEINFIGDIVAAFGRGIRLREAVARADVRSA